MKRIPATLLFSAIATAGISAAQGPEIGTQAPVFELKDSTGKTFSLADYRGKNAVVLEFFRSGSW